MNWRETSDVVWLLLALALLGYLVAARLIRNRQPGLLALVAAINSTRAGRVVLALAWMWLGWHAFAR